IKREPLRRLAPDPGELSQLRHEIIDGRHGELQRQLKRERQARGELLHFRLVELGGALLRLRNRGEHEVLEHLDIPLGNRLGIDRKSTRLNSSHDQISYAVFCLKKKKVVLRGGISHRTHSYRSSFPEIRH